MDFVHFIELIGKLFELAGVVILVVGGFVVTIWFIGSLIHNQDRITSYKALRGGLGRAILTGLEFLVAADIIRSVAIDPTLQSVTVLGLIVLIRTFLSWSLQVEITGVWPWEKPHTGASVNSNSS